MCEHVCFYIYMLFFGGGLFVVVWLVILSYSDPWLLIILFYYYSCLFSKEIPKEVELDGREDGEELGEVGGGDIVIRIYCVKKYIFNKRKKSNRSYVRTHNLGGEM